MKLSTTRKLTIGLGVLVGLLALFSVLQKALGIGTGYQFLSGEKLPIDADLLIPLNVKSDALTAEADYLEVNTRFLFSKDRAPPPKIAAAVNDVKEIPPVPLNMQLTGVVITANKKIAMLRSTDGSQSFRLQEGRPLPGERAGWTLAKIESRKVMFDGGPNGQQELKLDVAANTGAPMPYQNNGLATPMPIPGSTPMPGMPQNPNMNPSINPGVNPNMPMQDGKMATAPAPPPPPPTADQAAREAEVQRIIEERRAQMRAEAERMNSDQQ